MGERQSRGILPAFEGSKVTLPLRYDRVAM